MQTSSWWARSRASRRTGTRCGGGWRRRSASSLTSSPSGPHDRRPRLRRPRRGLALRP
jgi:hypothetical protein